MHKTQIRLFYLMKYLHSEPILGHRMVLRLLLAVIFLNIFFYYFKGLECLLLLRSVALYLLLLLSTVHEVKLCLSM